MRYVCIVIATVTVTTAVTSADAPGVWQGQKAVRALAGVAAVTASETAPPRRSASWEAYRKYDPYKAQNAAAAKSRPGTQPGGGWGSGARYQGVDLSAGRH